MKPNIASAIFLTLGVLALLYSVSVNARAQQTKGQTSAPDYFSGKTTSKPLPDGGPAPRLADGHTDLSGIWFVGALGKEDATLVGSGATAGDPALRAFDPSATPEEKPSFQPSEKLKELTSNLDADAAAGGAPRARGGGRPTVAFDKLPKSQQIAMLDREILTLTRTCMPHGVPRIGLEGGHGMQLVQSPGVLVQLVELNHDSRAIPTDGRTHSKSPVPAFNGEEVGHWEGDTLVVDTIAIDERVWNSDQWTFHSDQEHVIERFTRPSRNYLIYQVTVDDPKVLTKPWTSAPHRWSLSVSPDPLDEWYCGVSNDEEVTALKETKKRLEEQK